MLTQYLPEEGHLMFQTRYRVTNKSVKHYSQFGDALSTVSKMAKNSSNVKFLIPYVEPLYIPVISDTIENTNKFKLGTKGSVGQNKRPTDITLLPLRLLFVPLPYYSPRSVSFYPSPYSTFNVWCLAYHSHHNCVFHFMFMFLRTVPSSPISPVTSFSSNLSLPCLQLHGPACSSTRSHFLLLLVLFRLLPRPVSVPTSRARLALLAAIDPEDRGSISL